MAEALVPIQSASLASAAGVSSAVVVGKAPAHAGPHGRSSVPKRSSREAWGDWRATGSPASATYFCDSVSSWLEGTAAQLVRPLWPAGGARPSLLDVQASLRKGLRLVVTQEADYVDGLTAARQHVQKELSKARARDQAAG
ncbi:MAG: hypothetical protein NVSMB4_08200 [Acidimicrobiales bacterium]